MPGEEPVELAHGTRVAIKEGDEWLEGRVTMHSRELSSGRQNVILKHRIEFDGGGVHWHNLSELEYTYTLPDEDGLEELAERAWRYGAQAEAEAQGAISSGLVGERVCVLVVANSKWMPATVLGFNEANEKHQLRYDGAASST